MPIDHQNAVKARADYLRTRTEYLRVLATEPDHVVAVAMIAHEMKKANERFKAAVAQHSA